MLEDRTARDHAEALTLEVEAADQAIEGRGEHVLVADLGVCLVLTRERNAVAAEDRDRTLVASLGCVSHLDLPGMRVDTYSVFLLQSKLVVELLRTPGPSTTRQPTHRFTCT